MFPSISWNWAARPCWEHTHHAKRKQRGGKKMKGSRRAGKRGHEQHAACRHMRRCRSCREVCPESVGGGENAEGKKKAHFFARFEENTLERSLRIFSHFSHQNQKRDERFDYSIYLHKERLPEG